MALPAQQGSCQPTAVNQRIEVIDLLRGLALCGILLINIQHFSMYSGVARNPTLYGDLQGANFWVYGLSFTLAFQKFLPIFSMLFGAGIVLAATRCETASMLSARIHRRRMLVLLGIGLGHAYLIWYGDILVTYAVCGLVVYLFRHSPPRDLLGLGLVGLVVSQVLRMIVWVLPALLEGGGGQWAGAFDQVIVDDLAVYRGSWLAQFRARAAVSFETQTAGLIFIQFWRVSGIMLLGMALYKLGVLTAARSRQFYGLLVAIALFVAIPITAIALNLNVRTGWESAIYRGLAYQCIYWFGLVTSLGWIGLTMLACPGGRVPALLRPLAAVGRMALTNYLMHSVVCTTIFYGFGLGLYGSVDRMGQLGIVVAIWIFQLVVSHFWLRHFQFGPAEWLWRSLTYCKQGDEFQIEVFRGRSSP